MSTTIAPVAQLVIAIRAQLSGSTRLPGARRAPGTRHATGRRYTDSALAALIETRTGQIALDDPHRGRKAFRIFLEIVLLTNFGEELMHDPKFYQLLDDVQTALEADPATGELVRQATAHLLLKQNGAALRHPPP